jgi:F-box-like
MVSKGQVPKMAVQVNMKSKLAFIEKWCQWPQRSIWESSACTRPSCAQPAYPQPANHFLRLARLPVELLLLIFAFLPPESVAAAGLASKDLFDRVLSTDGYLFCDPLVKQRFLLLLEQDLPSHILCYTCNKLYNWRKSPILVSLQRYCCPARCQDSHPHFARLCGGCPQVCEVATKGG